MGKIPKAHTSGTPPTPVSGEQKTGPTKGSRPGKGKGRRITIQDIGAPQLNKNKKSGPLSGLSLWKRSSQVIEPGKLKVRQEDVSKAQKKTIKALQSANTSSEYKTILTEQVKSTSELCSLCRQLPDKSFSKMKSAINDRLKVLEAKSHVEVMLNQCRDKKGRIDTSQVAKTLAQHREFMTQSTANLFFTDGANYVKTRLNMPSGEGPVEILSRIRGCSPQDFRLLPEEVEGSNVSKDLDMARRQGGQVLKEARDKAAKKAAAYLEAHSPGKVEHIRFQSHAATQICRTMESMLLDQLEPGDHDQLRDDMASLRAKSLVGDMMLKVKDLSGFQQRMDDVFGNMPKGAPPEQVMNQLIGEQNINSDAVVLGRLVSGERVPTKAVKTVGQKEVQAACARQLATELSKQVQSLADQEGVRDPAALAQAMSLSQTLRKIAVELEG
ncbi:hypothetical protein [Parendozoicomonas haliclonae]|uniref:Uncharacterized protein n=1 Tax=Parendozoicomonas haliclonae TaxID=1960125 RepID=A0A1X7ANX1_9GAMM|nr:hypothetical protein [Parendozoicomonas haliclonae]SMA50004.1 hypothetical protein EHSB41UT_03795 [Parendozoicomonas haliclonae]